MNSFRFGHELLDGRLFSCVDVVVASVVSSLVSLFIAWFATQKAFFSLYLRNKQIAFSCCAALLSSLSLPSFASCDFVDDSRLCIK